MSDSNTPIPAAGDGAPASLPAAIVEPGVTLPAPSPEVIPAAPADGSSPAPAPTPDVAAPSGTPEVKPEAAPEIKSDASPEAKVPEASPEVGAQAAPGVYTDFVFPKGVTAAPEILSKAKETFAKLGLGQAQAQELVSLHTEVTQQAVSGAFEQATTYWNEKSKAWQDEVRKEFGNSFDTNIKRARGFWNETLPNEADRTRLFGDLTDTKIGDHPILAKALNTASRRFEQVMEATGTTTWADAMKKLREPAAPRPGQPAHDPRAGARPADRRYQPKN